MAGPAHATRLRTAPLRLGGDDRTAGVADGFGWRLAAITAVAVVARVLYVLLVGRHVSLGLDSVGYLFLGGGLAHGHGYSNPTLLFAGKQVATANFPPLYPVFVGLVDRVGITSTSGIQVVSGVAGAATVPLVGVLGRRLVDPRTGLAAAALVAVWPFLVAADGSLMSETIAVPLVTAAFLATVWAVERPRARRFVVVGALFGLAALARAEAPILMVCVVGIALLARRRVAVRSRLLAGAVTLLAFACVTAPWVAYVVDDFGTTALWATDGAKTLAGANCASTFSGSRTGLWDVGCVASEDWPRVTEADVARQNRHAATRYVRTHLARAPVVAGVRVLRTAGLWNPRQQRDFEAVESRDATWQSLGWCAYILALPFAAAGVVLLLRRDPRAWAIVGMLVGVALASALSDGNQRIRLAAEPEILLCAAVGAGAAWSRLRVLRPRRGRAAGSRTRASAGATSSPTCA